MLSARDILPLLDQLNTQTAEELESEVVDFKAWMPDKRNLFRYLAEMAVCFANAHGGVVVLGVRDRVKGRERAIEGCHGYDLNEMKRAVYTQTDPPILVEVQEIAVPEGVVLAMFVPKGVPPHTTADGLGKIRVGRSCQPLTGSIRRQLAMETGEFDLSAKLVGVGLEVLDPLELKRLRDIIRASSPTSHLLTLPDGDLLTSLGVVKRENGTLQVSAAGLLLLGREDALREFFPGHELIYLHMKSDTEYDKRLDLRSPILCLLETISRTIESFNSVYTVKVGLFHFEVPDFPPDAFREALLNALAHRDYGQLSPPVYVRHYRDRLEISNPGGFIGGISPQNILHHGPKHRNRLLMEILQKVRLVERSGIGVQRIYVAQLANGKEPPRYEATHEQVCVTLRNGNMDERFAGFVASCEKEGIALGLDDLLVLFYLKRNKEIGLKEAMSLLQRSEHSTRQALVSMVARGFMESGGRGRGRLYRLSRLVYERIGSLASYIRDKGIDERKWREMVLDLVREKGTIANRDCREMLGISKLEASRVLAKLVQEGLLRREGTSPRNFRYVPRV